MADYRSRGRRGGGGRGPPTGRGGRGPPTGRGGGGPGQQQPSPATGRGSGGRGQQPMPSAVGQARVTNTPPPLALSSSAPSFQPVPASAALSHDMEQKLTIASSSQPPAAEVNPPQQPQLPPVSEKNVRNPLRPGFGTAGKKTIVKANHFLVNIADRDLHHYDVAITPEVTSKPVCREIMTELVKSYQTSHLGKRMLAYDGRKSVYTAGELPFASKDFVVKLVDKDGVRKEREFKVSIKFAAKADLYHMKQFVQSRSLDAPHETLQALDVVLRQKPSNCYEVIGRSFFHPKLGKMGDLGNGTEYWKGFYQSLRPTQMDMSARAFFQPILVSDYVAEHFSRELTRPLSDQDRIKVKKTLRGVKVVVNYQKNIRRYKISGVSTEQIQHLMFNLGESETKISVAEYYRQTYKITLKYPFLPALQAGSDTKPVYLPMELCQIVEGQRYSKRLNERQVAALLKATCQRPNERERSIVDMVKENNYNGDQLVNVEFGIHVKPELTSIEARVLPPPMLLYHATGRESRVEPRVGQWNMIDKKMINGGKVEHWTCVNFSRSQRDPSRFINELIDMCNSKGMEFNPNPLIQPRTAQPNQIEKTLYDMHAESCSKLASMKREGEQLQLLFIILPDVSGSYGRIKCVCETELGIVSQCCQPKQTLKLSKQYMENVSLKINVKVGGRNTVLEMAHLKTIPLLSDRPTIIFGADVTHPQPGEDSSPSIAAVVASMDWPNVTMYRGLVSAQAHREEIIQDLYKSHQDPIKGTVHSGLIREHLVAFYKKTRTKPQRIIFYRDGVSEGQFNQVLLYEIDAIRKACSTLEENYLPRITFVVVQKRHHTRLFPNNHGDRNSTDRSGNILPGTVVDTKICHPNEFDFYLCSHAGIQGTSRPTHYHVLYDENGFNANCLQMLTNSLCYTYARCTRSVSIVPPAYYAHLAAFRARYYIEGTYSDTTSSIGRGESGAGATREKKAAVRPLPVIKDNVKDVMFYC